MRNMNIGRASRVTAVRGMSRGGAVKGPVSNFVSAINKAQAASVSDANGTGEVLSGLADGNAPMVSTPPTGP